MPTPASDLRPHIDRRRRQMLLALAAAPTLVPGLTSAGRRGLQWLDPRPSAPALLLRAADGTLYDRSAVSGRVLIVNFWSIWCRPCREEMPALQRLHSRFGDKGLAVWGVAVGDAPESVAEFGSTQGLRFPLLPDPERETLATWDVSALPTTAVVDKRGRIAFRVIGDAAWDKPPLSDHVAALVQGP
ncbi:hypothetical protein CKO31_15315 [Thiohalocapsa halophila]|uniref:Thioredoxin domain-containing protein n=1 Tax=Thiohalocapsa halophila TaxID=69359 RepID=A0ABS1CJT0_9GAMM|nr:hypothetical protein [Thiohalocapsa halophila]